MLEKTKLYNIIKKILLGAASKEEEETINQHFSKHFDSTEWEEEYLGNKEKIKRNILAKLERHITNQKTSYKKIYYKRFIAAAALIFIISVSLLMYMKPDKLMMQKTDIENRYLEPGTDKASLELADGRIINLEDLKAGKLHKEPSFTIEKSDEGIINYIFHGTNKLDENASTKWNTIRTPYGGKYHIILGDGTKVWMNAGSSLTFPEHFSKNERTVQAYGEIFFEVFHDKSAPFIVHTKGVEIQVLGTSFNLSTYENANNKTQPSIALMDGLVLLKTNKASAKILPGTKATIIEGHITSSNFDTESEISWKDNYFIFKDQNITKILDAMARWYNAEIVYKGNQWQDKNFTIRMSRRNNLQEILSIIERTESIKFQIKGRRVIVSKK